MIRDSRVEKSVSRVVQASLLAMTVFLGACSTTRSNPPAPMTTDAPELRYKIGPLDQINVVVWRNPDLSTTVTVRPDGRISTPLVEDLMAADHTPADLAREMEKVLSKYIRDPVVTIAVSQFQGNFADQVRIVGEAAKPQSVPYRQNMTLLDLMIQVGGLTDFADGNGAVLVRGTESGKQYQVRLRDLLKRGDISANVPIKPGDIIIVPQSWF